MPRLAERTFADLAFAGDFRRFSAGIAEDDSSSRFSRHTTSVLPMCWTEFGADRCQDRISLGAIFPIDPDLDELMSLKGVVDFLEYRGSQAVAGYADDGIKVVGLCAKRSPLGGTEFSHFATH